MLGIGRGLMTNGQFMLIDEPSLGLAPKLIDQIYESLSEMKESGITFLSKLLNTIALESDESYNLEIDPGMASKLDEILL